MEKKVFRFFQPSIALCFAVLLGFSVVAFLLDLLVLAALEAGVTLVLFISYLTVSQKKKRELQQYIMSTTSSRDTALNAGVPFPMAVIRIDTNEIMWTNSQFQSITGSSDSVFHTKMEDLIPQFNSLWLLDGKTEFQKEVTFNERRYRMLGNVFRPRGADSGHLMASVYLLDQTELLEVRDEYIRSRPVAALVLIDNYDELTNNLPDGQISILNAQIDAKITSWTSGISCLCRKLERNRYLLMMESKYLAALQEGRFSLLESIRTVLNPAGVATTVSIGIGKEGADFEECYNFSVLALEMALSRGGDQAVIKDRYNFSFFGGKSRETTRHTKVKSRVLAGSLAELIRQSSHVFIMGHKNADLDSVGAAAGLCCLCRKLGKPAHIILDKERSAARDLVQQLSLLDSYDDTFLSTDDAMLLADPKSLLIIVDTNRPEQVESRQLLETIPKVVLIDHHRKAADSLDEVALSLHEPSASSASELVTEVLQYSVESRDLLPEEAKALLAGIALDTKNFSVRTGSGTFEAAAFLRRVGADPTAVRQLFQSDMKSAVERYGLIQKAKVYQHNTAIAVSDCTVTRATAAQAADELLNISGISASFVLFPDGDKVIISARSMSSTNVQMILEPLGGGGNQATAGAQIAGKTVQEVLQELLTSIDQYYEEK